MTRSSNSTNNGPVIDLNDDFLLDDISRKDYTDDHGDIDIEDVIHDMQRIIVYTINPYLFYIKSRGTGTDSSMRLEIMQVKNAMVILGSIVVGEQVQQTPTGKNSFKTTRSVVTLKSIFESGTGINSVKNKFLVRGVQFLSDDPRIFNVFRGYPKKLLPKINMSVIQPFLNHILEVVCRNNVEYYEYFLNWIAFPLQNPGLKNCTAIIVLGDHGTGKGDFLTLPISKLFGRYAAPNINKMEDIVGQFNTTIENKALLVCNEIQSIDNAKHTNFDAMKSIITEYNIIYNDKHIPRREGINVGNFMFITNNYIAVKLENSDRRYFVLETSNEHRQDKVYFKKLATTFTNEFYDMLYTFLMNRDLSKYEPTQIPNTEAKTDLIQACKPSWQLFFEENMEEFLGNGWLTTECYAQYVTYCKNNGYHPMANTTFGGNLKRYAKSKQITGGGRYYRITEDGIKHMKFLKDTQPEEVDRIEETEELNEDDVKPIVKDIKKPEGKNRAKFVNNMTL